MITTALIVIGAIVSVVAVLVFILSLVRAPEGMEDESGFHTLKEPGPARSRYYSATRAATLPVKSAKPFKAHIPAA